MKESRKTNIKVGITTILAIAILIWVLGWAKRITIAGDYYVVKMKFNSVSGLEIGDHITINGVKMGKVKDIILDGNKVIVEGLIPKYVPLKRDAKAKVEMMDLMGGKKIEIKPGESDEPFELNTFLVGDISTDIPGALSMVGSVEQDLRLLIKDTRTMLEKINYNLSDPELISSLKSSIINLETTSKYLNDFFEKNDKALHSTVKNISGLTERIEKFISQDSDTLMIVLKETQNLISNLNEVSSHMRNLLKETSNKENNIGRLLYDQESYEKLKESIERIDEITKTLIIQLNEKGIKVDAKIRLF